MIEITNENFDNYLNDELLVVDIWSPSCGPCRTYGPIFEKVSNELTNITMAKLDGSINRDVLSKYEVRSVPTTLFIKRGELVDKKVGIIQPNDLIDLINKYNN